nr:elongation factor-like GTPase 1 [Tanacetum cinerariifolium]
EEDTFHPQKRNVVFACVLDGWGFRICYFANFYASKLGVYESTLDTNGDKWILEKLIKSFNLSVLPHELQNKDLKVVLQLVMSRWLLLSDAILSMVVKHIPDPVTEQSFRISQLLLKREILDSDVGKSDVIAEAELTSNTQANTTFLFCG